MPDRAPAPRLVAHLSLEVGDELGSTTATLIGDGDVVLDVMDPVVLLRCLPGQASQPTVPPGFPVELLTGHRLGLSSGGRDLGRITVTRSGRVSFRPTLAGTPTLARTAASVARTRVGSRRLAAVGGAAGTLAVLVAIVRAVLRGRRHD